MTEGVDGQLLNPLEFAKDILRVELWSKQEEELSALFENRRVAVKSGNGLGKGYCAAVVLKPFHLDDVCRQVLNVVQKTKQFRPMCRRSQQPLMEPS